MADMRIGTFLTLPGATAAELFAEPWDVVLIDLEHASLSLRDAQEMTIGAQAAGAEVLVRLPADAHRLIAVTIDAGVDGVVLADVADPAVAADAASRLRHAPAGTRGYGPRRASLRGRRGGAGLRQPQLWVQIERPEGVAAAERIAAVPGVDALVVGTADLSFALGAPLDTRTAPMAKAVDAVRRACRAAGVAFGVAGALEAAPPELLAGASILLTGTDARLAAAGVDAAADRLRALAVPTRPSVPASDSETVAP
jgi:4-hydroxy-2-oxoheptanedioate aldolase